MDLRIPWLQNARNGGRPGAHNIGQNPLFMRGRGNVPGPGQQLVNNIRVVENARGDDDVPVQVGMNLKKIMDGKCDHTASKFCSLSVWC